MRLFKSRKSGEYNDVSSVVANENDPHVKIVSCSSQQEFHSTENGSINKTIDPNECPSSQQQHHHTNGDGDNDDDDSKKLCATFNQMQNHSIRNHNHIPYSLKHTDNHCNDKFTPIPDCDKFDEPAIHSESSKGSSTTAKAANAIVTTMTPNTTTTSTTPAIAIETANMPETVQHSDTTSDFINELFGMFAKKNQKQNKKLHWTYLLLVFFSFLFLLICVC